MKKIISRFGLIALMLSACMVTFTACGDDDDENGGETPTPTATTATITYSYTVGSDMLSIADVTISYEDASGKTVTEAMTSTTWTAKVTKEELPCSFNGFKVNATLKDVELTKDSYSLGDTPKYSVNVGGEVYSHGSGSSLTIGKENVAAYIAESVNGKTYGACTVSSDGTVR